MARTTWGPLSTDEQNQIEFAPVGEPGVLAPGTAGGLLKRNANGTMGNSILSESGSLLTLLGRLAINGGTVTASTPVLDLTQTWNLAGTTFTGLKFNVTDSASASASLSLDIQRNGSSVFSVSKVGNVAWNGSITINSDVILQRGAADVLEMRRTTSAQTFNLYGTTDASTLNYRRIRTTMTTGGAAVISAEGLGTGVSGNTLAFAMGSSASPTTVLSWDTSNNAAIAGDLQFATGSYVKWNGRTKIGGATDGILLLVNNAGSDFGRIQFGGTSAIFPALKRNNTEIQARLADDSTFAPTQSLYERFGSGSPEGAVSAPVSTTYHRNDGGAGTSLYVKESGSGNTGWVAK